MPTFADRGCHRVSVTDAYDRTLGFLDRSRYYFFHVAPQSLTVREEHRLEVFENRVLRRIYGPKRDEVSGDWRKLHDEELHDLYSSPSIIRLMKARRMKWAWHVARKG
jgi:hypothetical protein